MADAAAEYALPRPPAGAPNVVMIVLDDLGFAQLGCYGSDIATPRIDALAAGGLRYNRFHVTALCSPTRACLLTGRNHHAVGVGFLPDMPIAHPGYTGRVPDTAATLPRILRDEGYSTSCVGKWHLTPGGERGSAGPFDRWPLGFGFERYYGFLHGDANHWAPEPGARQPLRRTSRDPRRRLPPQRRPDRRGDPLRHRAPAGRAGPPFFLYFALGRDPLAPPRVAGVERPLPRSFRRRLGPVASTRCTSDSTPSASCPSGTELSERPEWIPDWEALTADERRTMSRQMEVFAGFLTHTDAQIGRVVDQLARLGVLDDTVIMLVSDNGASAEGGTVGTFNEHRFTDARPRHHRRQRRVRSTISVGSARIRTTRGVGVGRQHSAATLEALHVARWVPDPADRAPARRVHRAR